MPSDTAAITVSVPGAEVLGAEVLAEMLLEVVVDVVGTDRMPAPTLPVSQQLVAAGAASAQGRDQLVRRRVGDHLSPLRAAFGGVVELDGVRVHRDVLAVQRREPESAVILGVLLAPDPKDADVEQADRARQHALSRWLRILQL